MYILLTILGVIVIRFIWSKLWKPIILKLHVSCLTKLLLEAYDYYRMETEEADKRRFEIIYEMYNRAANTPRDFSLKEFEIILKYMIIDSDQKQQTEKEMDDYAKDVSIKFANLMFFCFLLRSPVFVFPMSCLFIFFFIKANTVEKCSHITQKFLSISGVKNKPQDFIEQGA